MTIHWFYSEALPAAPGTFVLDRREAAHAASRRLRPHESVRLFDGAGSVAIATVLQGGAGSRRVAVQVESIEHRPAPLACLHLASALPTGERLAVMLDMATQLGMTDFTPLHCERGRPPRRDDAADKWRRITIESCKQCQRAWLPAIHAGAAPAEVARAGVAAGIPVLLADQRGEPMAHVISGASASKPGSILCLVGPEGGFTGAEIGAVTEAGARPVTLGEYVLRIETAAAAMLAIAAALTGASMRSSA
ncbi:MAG: 16S rRNA (uracil(1498)-N(3))-methyltransferase [Phycisphaeraceae bacterium]|nr:16S rRNA (uracil(1498)-N(3))-methyltransferase [Phycisphaerales bacterium]QOJ16202.1 MAG: 16S rRNA (uracil(1498)-N(3))-methyltransferase [Phycisphaeraceae bacterium]